MLVCSRCISLILSGENVCRCSTRDAAVTKIDSTVSRNVKYIVNREDLLDVNKMLLQSYNNKFLRESCLKMKNGKKVKGILKKLNSLFFLRIPLTFC